MNEQVQEFQGHPDFFFLSLFPFIRKIIILDAMNENIQYITIPSSLEKEIRGFKVRSDIKIPIQLPNGVKKPLAEHITIQAICAGIIIVIAYHPEDKNFEYYKDFLLSCQPDCIQELNTAAITKERQKDYPFAEQLFLAVYHLLPQSASCINLATLYSSWAAFKKKENNEKEEDFYTAKCLNTLKDGLEKFGENEAILAELGSVESYLGNLEEANEYLSRYVKVATEGEKKEKLKKILKEVRFRIDSDNEINQAYDFMMLEEEDKALRSIDSFLQKNPNIWHGHFIKGWALRKKKEYAEAEKSFLRCLELGESNSEIYNELSICSLETGRRDLAKNYLDIAIELDSDNFTLMNNLAYLNLVDGDYDEAKKWIEKCRQIAPEDKQIKAMMEEYTDKTGEEFKDIITEELVKTPDDDKAREKMNDFDGEDDGYEEELKALSEEDYVKGFSTVNMKKFTLEDEE